MRITIVYLMVTVVIATVSAEQLRLCAFNTQRFGPTKAENPEIMLNLVRLIHQCDIILLQEITDATGTALPILLNQVNRGTSGDEYAMIVSPRLGRTTYKEQYAYMYRPDVVELADAYTYQDRRDIFDRDPFVAVFDVHDIDRDGVNVERLAIVGVHVKPTNATPELRHLNEVVEQAVVATQTSDVVVMGDLNAGCSYVRRADWPTIPLWTDENFDWLIDGDTDTTSGSTHCPYDRIIVTGENLPKTVVEGEETGVFRMDQEFGLTSEQMAAISDHYPVRVLLELE